MWSNQPQQPLLGDMKCCVFLRLVEDDGLNSDKSAPLKWYSSQSKPPLLMRTDVEQTPSAAPFRDLQCCVFLGFVEYDSLNSDKKNPC